MYPYPYANNSIPQYPKFPQMNTNIPELQYVASAEGTDSITIPPNKSAVYFNQNVDEFYIISSDASGNRVRSDFTFKPKEKEKPKEYVTREEFDALKSKLEGKTTKRTTTKGEEENE